MIEADVDRIEEDWIVLVPDRGRTFSLPKKCYPELQEGNRVSIILDRKPASEAEFRRRTAEMKKNLKRSDLLKQKHEHEKTD